MLPYSRLLELSTAAPPTILLTLDLYSAPIFPTRKLSNCDGVAGLCPRLQGNRPLNAALDSLYAED
eukprot:416493-Heterocapsa_arctica.AAC.1